LAYLTQTKKPIRAFSFELELAAGSAEVAMRSVTAYLSEALDAVNRFARGWFKRNRCVLAALGAGRRKLRPVAESTLGSVETATTLIHFVHVDTSFNSFLKALWLFFRTHSLGARINNCEFKYKFKLRMLIVVSYLSVFQG